MNVAIRDHLFCQLFVILLGTTLEEVMLGQEWFIASRCHMYGNNKWKLQLEMLSFLHLNINYNGKIKCLVDNQMNKGGFQKIY